MSEQLTQSEASLFAKVLKEQGEEREVDVSIVIPLYNEVESLDMLYERVLPLLDDWDRSYELILVDDGSRDGTRDMLRDLHAKDNRIQVVLLRRNFGQTAAFTAGFDHAHGDVIVTMDGDLQNDPADIPMLLDKMEEGYDIVSGWRHDRQDKLVTRKLPSQAANKLISKMTGVELHDYGCSLKAYKRDVIEGINLYGEMHRFIPALASWMGVRVAEVPVNHSARQFGQSKYGLGRIVRVVLDLMTVKFLLDYATRPIQIFGLVGLGSLTVGTILGAYLTTIRLFFDQPIGDRPLVILAALLIMIGVQLIIMGLLGEIMVRTYHETQNKPIYAVRTVLGDATGTVPSNTVSSS